MLFCTAEDRDSLEEQMLQGFISARQLDKDMGGEAIPQTVISAITWVNTIWPLTPIVRCV